MKSEVRIRAYREGDYLGIKKVWKETGLFTSDRGDDEKVIQRTLELGGRFLVMEENNTGQIIGTSWMAYDGRRTHLHHFGILPLFQRQGLGQRLAEESLKVAKKLGVQIKLEVNRENFAAIKLYRNLGFKPLGDYEVYIIREFF